MSSPEDHSLKLILERNVPDPEAMQELCVEFFEKYLKEIPVSILLLEGELGAGKTTFTRGFMRALGLSDNVNSPTFNLLNDYEGAGGRLFHYDLYRIAAPEEVFEIGFVENWRQGEAPGLKQGETPEIHVIEWWRRAAEYFPSEAPTFQIQIDYKLDDLSENREVTIYRYGADLPGT